MIRSATITILYTILVAAPIARATEVSGDQSGTWSLANSPYELVGDVRVPPGQTLIIEPGVVVNAKGYYKLLVDAGTLLAVGTQSDPILMTAEDSVIGWKGVTLDSADDTSTLSYCVIEHAHRTGSPADVAGGAVYSLYCSPTISFNELRFNSSHNANQNGIGGGIACLFTSASITNNYIHDNSSDSGAGIYLGGGGSPYIANNVVSNNTAHYKAGGIHASVEATALIERNVISGNNCLGEAGGGIALWYWYARDGVYSRVRNNVIADNTAAFQGGGIHCSYDKTPLRNNIIVNNTAAVGGGIYALNDGVFWPSIQNSILWGNMSGQTPNQVTVGPGSAITVRWSNIQGGLPDLGNINADPFFVDAAADDYHLRQQSPCIDAGNPAFAPAPGETDMDGDPRVIGARVDMGADEFRRTGDLDLDGDVDASDFTIFAQCFGGSANPPAPACPPGVNADLDGDADVDASDFLIFAQHFTGSL